MEDDNINLAIAPESAGNIVHIEEPVKNEESDLRKAIQLIQADDSLDASSKAKKMQQLLSASWKQSRPLSRASLISSSDGSVGGDSPVPQTDASLVTTFHSLDPEPIMGCKHYMRNCKKFAECCQKWISCRFCHDDLEDHVYDRYSTKKMLCMFCKTEQEASNICCNMDCQKIMANYYCDICKFWDNDRQKKIYHCEKCKMCRIGKREDFYHCDKCNVCLVNDYVAEHKCIERNLECDCPICGEFLFTSLSPVMFMRCGHSIHFMCHREHIKNSYQCPVCLKSLGDMQEYFIRIDSLLECQPMPEEYAMVRSQILCNDCEAKTVTKFHFVYHKCSRCGSYNTKLLRTFNAESQNQQQNQTTDDLHNGHETSEHH